MTAADTLQLKRIVIDDGVAEGGDTVSQPQRLDVDESNVKIHLLEKGSVTSTPRGGDTIFSLSPTESNTSDPQKQTQLDITRELGNSYFLPTFLFFFRSLLDPLFMHLNFLRILSCLLFV